MIRRWLAALGTLGLLLSLATGANADVVLKGGSSAGPYAEILQFAADLAKKQGIEVKVIEFSDWTLPNAALDHGELDFNNFQHLPYLNNQIGSRGYKLVPIGKSIIVPFGLYSKKINSLSEIKDGASTAIPNDPTNAARGLELLQQAGLIKLRPDAGSKATLVDVVENPKKLKIKELDAAQLPRALDDLDFSVVSMNYALSAGLDPQKALLLEDSHTNWNLVFATQISRKDDPNILKFVEIYRSPEVKAFIQEKFKGSILTTW